MFLSFLFPEKCPYCKRLIKSTMTECDACRRQFPKKPHITVLPCGAECMSSFVYDGNVRKAILNFKFHGKKQYAKSFAKVMAEGITTRYGENAFDVVTCVPISKKRLKSRGYNQSEVIARYAAKHLGAEYLDTIEKTVNNREQHSLSLEERKTNIKGVYRLCTDKIKSKRVLLIDDIVTSGNTLSECVETINPSQPSMLICATVAVVMKS